MCKRTRASIRAHVYSRTPERDAPRIRTAEARRVIALARELGFAIRPGSGIGIKPISEFGSRRLVRKAIRHAIDRGLPSVTLIHKGNTMRFTEGAFKDWGYAVAREEFRDASIPEAEVVEQHGGKVPAGRVVIKDRLADSMFQQMLFRPSEFSVVAAPNQDGDYLVGAAVAPSPSPQDFVGTSLTSQAAFKTDWR